MILLINTTKLRLTAVSRNGEARDLSEIGKVIN
jgi:hypothetical protein